MLWSCWVLWHWAKLMLGGPNIWVETWQVGWSEVLVSLVNWWKERNWRHKTAAATHLDVDVLQLRQRCNAVNGDDATVVDDQWLEVDTAWQRCDVTARQVMELQRRHLVNSWHSMTASWCHSLASHAVAVSTPSQQLTQPDSAVMSQPGKSRSCSVDT